jgi:hypothetical protein
MKHIHHIIPRHMGGTNDPSNLVELSVEEHADAHRVLYETHGLWQDYVAWQGLSKLMTREDAVALMLKEAGKKGVRSRAATNLGKKYDTTEIVSRGIRKGALNPYAKSFLVTYPDGKQEGVTSLKTWCEENALNYNTFHKMCVSQGKTHKGYTAVLTTRSNAS